MATTKAGGVHKGGHETKFYRRLERIIEERDAETVTYATPPVMMTRLPLTGKGRKLAPRGGWLAPRGGWLEEPRGWWMEPPRRRRLGTRRTIDVALWQHVVTCATLRPEQWALVGGAELGRRAGEKKRPVPRLETHVEALLNRAGPPKKLVFDLHYPLTSVARVTIRPYTKKWSRTRAGRTTTRAAREMTVGYVLWQLARAYQQIYRERRKYGVWGHGIGDLWFEGMQVAGGIGRVQIGS